MQSLCQLDVQMASLYGDTSAVLETLLIDILLPNLVELTLEESWWSNEKPLGQRLV